MRLGIGVWAWMFFLCLLAGIEPTLFIFVGIPVGWVLFVLIANGVMYLVETPKRRKEEAFNRQSEFRNYMYNVKKKKNFDIREYLDFYNNKGWLSEKGLLRYNEMIAGNPSFDEWESFVYERIEGMNYFPAILNKLSKEKFL